METTMSAAFKKAAKKLIRGNDDKVTKILGPDCDILDLRGTKRVSLEIKKEREVSNQNRRLCTKRHRCDVYRQGKCDEIFSQYCSEYE